MDKRDYIFGVTFLLLFLYMAFQCARHFSIISKYKNDTEKLDTKLYEQKKRDNIITAVILFSGILCLTFYDTKTQTQMKLSDAKLYIIALLLASLLYTLIGLFFYLINKIRMAIPVSRILSYFNAEQSTAARVILGLLVFVIPIPVVMLFFWGASTTIWQLIKYIKHIK